MIKARELRIGNLIMLETDNFDFKDTIFRLNNVGQYRCTMSEINKSAFITKNTKFLKPIPLTEEWLLKFGFGVDNDYDNTFFNNVALEQAVITYSTTYRLFTLETDGGDEIQIKCEYVHSLQNLYFALTNEELTIK